MQRPPAHEPSCPRLVFCAVLFSMLALTVFSMPSHATQEPEYQVVRQLADIEVRQYAAYAVAEVVVPGPAGEAGNLAFPILAGYVFGKNKGERKFAMTAPVTQAAVPVKLQMTAPVTQTASCGATRSGCNWPSSLDLAPAARTMAATRRFRWTRPTLLAAASPLLCGMSIVTVVVEP